MQLAHIYVVVLAVTLLLETSSSYDSHTLGTCDAINIETVAVPDRHEEKIDYVLFSNNQPKKSCWYLKTYYENGSQELYMTDIYTDKDGEPVMDSWSAFRKVNGFYEISKDPEPEKIIGSMFYLLSPPGVQILFQCFADGHSRLNVLGTSTELANDVVCDIKKSLVNYNIDWKSLFRVRLCSNGCAKGEESYMTNVFDHC